MSGWQPIETAPRDGTRIRVKRPPAVGLSHCPEEGEDWWHQPIPLLRLGGGWWHSSSVQQPTHWMPGKATTDSATGAEPKASELKDQ